MAHHIQSLQSSCHLAESTIFGAAFVWFIIKATKLKQKQFQQEAIKKVFRALKIQGLKIFFSKQENLRVKEFLNLQMKQETKIQPYSNSFIFQTRKVVSAEVSQFIRQIAIQLYSLSADKFQKKSVQYLPHLQHVYIYLTIQTKQFLSSKICQILYIYCFFNNLTQSVLKILLPILYGVNLFNLEGLQKKVKFQIYVKRQFRLCFYNISISARPTMEQIQKVMAHKKLSIFMLYAVSFVVLGNGMLALGTIFPYLSAQSHRNQTQYSFLFLSRAIGFITGSLTVKWLEKRLSFHQGICMGAALSGLFGILFSFTTSFQLMGTFVYLHSVGNSFIAIFVNVSTIQAFKKDNLSTWLQSLHGCFGIGGLMGPFTVFMFELNSFIVIGLSFLVLIPLILRIPSPELDHQKSEQLLPETDINQQTQSKQAQILPNSLNYLISAIFFFVVGQECTFGGWISSYAVLQGFTHKEHATVYGSLFWISNTFFRFAFAFVPGKASSKVFILTGIAVVQACLSSVIVYNVNSQFGLVLSSLVFGMTNSVVFPLLLIVPEQFGYRVTPGQNSNFMILGSLGEGTLTVFVGYLMRYISYKWFFYSMGLFNFFACAAHFVSTTSLEKTKNEEKNADQELEDMKNKDKK